MGGTLDCVPVLLFLNFLEKPKGFPGFLAIPKMSFETRCPNQRTPEPGQETSKNTKHTRRAVRRLARRLTGGCIESSNPISLPLRLSANRRRQFTHAYAGIVTSEVQNGGGSQMLQETKFSISRPGTSATPQAWAWAWRPELLLMSG